MKIVSNPQLKQYLEFANAIPLQFEKGGLVLQKKRNEIRIFEVNGAVLNVKRFKVPHMMNRIIYTFFRLSKAQRSFQYALKLKEMGIETPQPVAYILIKRWGLLHDSYYISMQVDYNPTMYEFGKGDVENRKHILEAFAIYTAGIHEKGIFHKDYSPGNILLKEDNGTITFCMVDINRMRFGDVSAMKGCANFARLWGTQPVFDIVVRKYAAIRGADPEKCLQYALQARKKYWRKYACKYTVPFALD